MAKFNKLVESEAGSRHILQGNEAFALGVVHAGYHAADGYPGTPSTEVIDKSLSHVQDRMVVGWSVNEAVAVGVAVGHAIAGHDTVVTMKIPGVFQAGDVISTSAFYTATAGALVLFVASDYVPSSTQHVIDVRYFLASCRVPVLEPRNHQEMYEIAWTAADISKKFNTPVIVLASGILTHSEGLVVTKTQRIVESLPIPVKLNNWMLLPNFARANYNMATQERIPGIRVWSESSSLVTEYEGTEEWAIIVSGESDMIVKEAMTIAKRNPSVLSLAITNPLPVQKISQFAQKYSGKLFVIEDGDRFLEEKIRLMNIDVIGKGDDSIITDWQPQMILEFLSGHVDIPPPQIHKSTSIQPLMRPPAICPGCPYKAFALAVDRLKKKKKIYGVFGDIGCSTLLYFLNSLDTVLCMGASDAMRQGFVLSHPEMAHKCISVVGDSCECHSGMDATRNAIFRNTPGVKVILDNRITAMTGGQPAPSTPYNLAGQPHNFDLKRALAAEGGKLVVMSSYDLKEVDRVLTEALQDAETGQFTTLVFEGPCVHEVEAKEKIRAIKYDYELCKRCGRCGICPGIEHDSDRKPSFTNLCSNCGGNPQVCFQRCPFSAIVKSEAMAEKESPVDHSIEFVSQPISTVSKKDLPESLRVSIRGIGGQGSLFFGKVLSEIALRTPYADSHIVKGDTHGMAQLGGSVISTFCCGNVYSTVLAPKSADILVVMEISEVLRPGFLESLKDGGTIILNSFKALPPTAKKEDYPDVKKIDQLLVDYKTISIDANKTAYEMGDFTGRTANVVVLGLLSTIEPFSAIPVDIWEVGLLTISPTDAIKSINIKAFRRGRELKL